MSGRALIVQLVAYEVQFELQKAFEKKHAKDNMDYAVSNTLGAMAAVLAACVLSFVVAHLCHNPYQKRVLHSKSHAEDSKKTLGWSVHISAALPTLSPVSPLSSPPPAPLPPPLPRPSYTIIYRSS